ncbi:MAG: sugar ABC transporter permease [Acidimicrobiales bacterium]|jgi:alpha-glucoside transport system permease protein|nr:sugar ABC transporter permease [Acidimicrobiales bacterium]|tara:strand:+ start:3303 stop:5186 length:1884 start_codon:yes stop_codon:yes gene_type:complete
MDALTGALWGSTAAIGISMLLFLGANRLFDLVVDRWRLFVVVVGALGGAATFGILAGNRVLDGSRILWIVAGGAMVAAVGVAPALFSDRRLRLAVGVGSGALVGLVMTFVIDETVRPTISMAGLALVVGVACAVYLICASRFGRVLPGGVLVAATLGWTFGCWLLGDIGGGSWSSMAVAVIGPTSLLGAALGVGQVRTRPGRERLQHRTRVGAFLGPALLFVVLGLIVPLARTIYLSLYDARGRNWVGFKNYGEILTNDRSIDLADWANIFTSRLFVGGVGLLTVGAIVGLGHGRRRGRALEPVAGSVVPAVAGGLLLVFAVFSSLRGTVMNNLWWLIVVTLFSTGLGLAAAVLADRARFEALAKSLVFLPMAISFVGAGIIWRFMYIARPPQKPQTGVLNAVWVGLGKLAPGTAGQAVGLVVLAVLTAGMAGLCLFGVRRRQNAIAIGAALSALPVLWLAYRLVGPGLGGVEEGPLGLPIGKPILFAQEGPFNNVWLMVVLIWIQTGFAMVILSAAIKAVPGDIIEAARVDGANDRQVFFRVTLPTIVPTIIVIVTTLIVLVMKVFDIVRVMTNGNFGTQVIANEMWQRTFTEFNLGLGSALAAVLFLGVVPAMALNVRRLQRGRV